MHQNSADDVAELEGKVQMPKGAAPLNTFTREYAGRIERGHRLIVGLYSGSGGKIVIDKSPAELNDTTVTSAFIEVVTGIFFPGSLRLIERTFPMAGRDDLTEVPVGVAVTARDVVS
jgi:hypothetical protein